MLLSILDGAIYTGITQSFDYKMYPDSKVSTDVTCLPENISLVMVQKGVANRRKKIRCKTQDHTRKMKGPLQATLTPSYSKTERKP